MQIFEKTLKVKSHDLDNLDHVNNVRYVQWIQDISEAHWESRAPEDMKASSVWVVVKHVVHYKNAAKLGDEVHIKTYIKKSEGVISTRVVEMRNKTTDALLITSETDWCLINALTHKPMRINESIRSLFIDKPISS